MMRTGQVALLTLLIALGFASLSFAQAPPLVIADFESDGEMAQWEATGQVVHCPEGYCDPQPATISRVAGHATHGTSSCQLDLPPDPVSYAGMKTYTFPSTDWSSYNALLLDVENTTGSALTLTMELSDSIQGEAWLNRCTVSKALVPGLNQVKVGLDDLPTNGGGQVDITHMGVLSVFVSGLATPTTIYCDYIRLETIQDDPDADAARGIYKFDFGTATSPNWPDFYRVTPDDLYPVGAAPQSFGWDTSVHPDVGRYASDYGGPDDLCRDFVRALCCEETWNSLDFRLDLPNGDYTVCVIAQGTRGSGLSMQGWQLSAEGAAVVDVPLTAAEFYTTDYFYRGLESDYPPSASAWEQFEEPIFSPHTFTTNVTDGHLDLAFRHASVYMLVVYPNGLASEMEPRLADWEAQRQEQFEGAYYINSPRSLTFTPTTEESARGFAVWPIASMDPVLPDSLPPDPRPALVLTTSAVPGERRPVSLALRPVVDLAAVSVQVSALNDGEGHTIPASAVTPQYVRYLPTPDAEFFGSGVLTWKPRLVQDDFPIDIPAQVSKQLWLEVQVPQDALGGTYTGMVTITTPSGPAEVPLTVEVWPVQLDSADRMAYGWYYMDPGQRYCFDSFPELAGESDAMLRLDLADMRAHGFNSLQFPGPVCEDIDSTTGHVGTLNTAGMERYVAAMRDTGFGGDWPGQWVTLGVSDAICGSHSPSDEDFELSEAFGLAYTDVLERMEAWSNSANGVPLVEWLLDEPRESMLNPWNRNFADTMEYAALANAVPGVQTTVTVMGDSGDGVDYTPFADALDIMQTHAWPQSEGLINGARDQGKPNWFYNTGGDLRLVYGFYNYAWALESGGAWQWHYDWLDGDVFDPFPYSPFNNHWRYTYPSPDGPVPTLKYEWASQGIWDYRYAATLDRLMREAQASEEADLIAWAGEAAALLDELKTKVPQFAVDNGYQSIHFAGIAEAPGCLTEAEEQLDSYRAQIADLILRRPGEVSGAVCAVMDLVSPSLVWDATGSVSFTLRNISTDTWASGGGYAVSPIGENDRWSIGTHPLTADVAPQGTADFALTVIAPPWTTIGYPAGAEQTDPGTTAGAATGYGLLRNGELLSGGLVPAEITISRFPDVQPGTPGEWARFYVEECAGRAPQIVQGYPDGSYKPTVSVTRDQMAVYIARAAGYSLPAVTAPVFPDVPIGHWAAAFIAACVNNDVVVGYPDGSYKPAVPVTRDQMAVYVARAKGYSLSIPTGPVFPDVPADHWAAAFIAACVANDVVYGYPDGNYKPDLVVTRDQMAVYVYRSFIQPTGVVVALGGPAMKDIADTSSGPWASLASGPASDPGYTYVVLDAMRLGPGLAHDGAWHVQFELRDPDAPDTPASGAYTSDVTMTAAELATARAAAAASGNPYQVVLQWGIPGGLTPDAYVLVVSAEDAGGVMQEFGDRRPFTIVP